MQLPFGGESGEWGSGMEEPPNPETFGSHAGILSAAGRY